MVNFLIEIPRIAGQQFRIVEVEAYVHSPHHADPYAHGDEGSFGNAKNCQPGCVFLFWVPKTCFFFFTAVPLALIKTMIDMPRQATCGNWYFHKKGGTYKSGSFKGMDLACGDKESNVFAGFLLRAIIDSSEKLIEGPCLVVDKILELNGDFAARGVDAVMTGTVWGKRFSCLGNPATFR